MKNLKFTGMLIAILLAATFIFPINSVVASDLPNDYIIVKIKSIERVQKMEVRLANLIGEKTTIRILDDTGQVYFRNVVKGEAGFAVKLDLTNLQPGIYRLTINQENVQIVRHFDLTENTVVLGDQEKWTRESASDESVASH